MSYQLFKVPDGYETDLILVIAPYFCEKFVKELIRKLHPKKIRFVIDDGARAEEIEKLRKCCGNSNVKIALSAGVAGLVHLKGFYFEFVKSEGREQRKRQFLFGSANATEAAFGGKINAELIANVDLYLGADRDLIGYLNSIIEAIETGDGKIEGFECDALRNSPRLLLPSFKVKKPENTSGFDSWLQRGYLAAKYRESQQFLTVAITLKKRLPQGVIAKTFAGRQLIEQGERNVVRFNYIDGAKIADEEMEDVTPQWKARYCVWTHIGDWISDDCFRNLGKTMRSKSSQAREIKIQKLLDCSEDENWKEERKNLFLNTLKAVWIDLQVLGVDPIDYFDGLSEGINCAQYGDRFGRKLAGDIIFARDKDFCERYIKGYEFPAIPRFRQDTVAWEEFAKSWCTSVIVEINKTSPILRLAKIILEISESLDFKIYNKKAEDVLQFLRKNWKVKAYSDDKRTVGEWIEEYFKDELK